TPRLADCSCPLAVCGLRLRSAAESETEIYGRRATASGWRHRRLRRSDGETAQRAHHRLVEQRLREPRLRPERRPPEGRLRSSNGERDLPPAHGPELAAWELLHERR